MKLSAQKSMLLSTLVTASIMLGSNSAFAEELAVVLCQDLVQVKMRFFSS